MLDNQNAGTDCCGAFNGKSGRFVLAGQIPPEHIPDQEHKAPDNQRISQKLILDYGINSRDQGKRK